MRSQKPTLRQLEYFLAVAEAGSYRRGADRLGVTQPTLTAQIAALETTLGAPVLERSRRGASLSPLGRELLGQVRIIVGEVQGLMDIAESARSGPTGIHRVGVPPTLGPYFLPHVVPELHKEFPAIRLYVRENFPAALDGEVTQGNHDFIFTPLRAVGDDLIFEQLFEEPLKVVVASDHPLAGQSSIPVSALRNQQILTLEEHHHLFLQINELCDRIGARLMRDYEGTSLDTLRHMAGMGLGVALMPSLYVESEITKRSGLAVLDIADEDVTRTIAMAWRPTAPSHQLYKRMAESIRKVLRRKLSRLVRPIR